MSALTYLLNRNFKKSTIIEWQLGVCPDWKVVTPKVIAQNHFAVAEKIGLVGSGNGNTWDYYHHRITIPIHDYQGKLIGFGGRLLAGQQGAKYFNPKASFIYDKSKTLFGLHKARKHFKTHGMACLVEGYFDVIKLHQHGWTNAIASCGTALTEGQAKLLKRFTDTVLILRDGDKAGQAATMKDIPILAAQQFTIYITTLPTSEDPDTLFDNPVKARSILEGYRDGIEWLCENYLSNGDQSATHIAKAIDSIVNLLGLITNTVRREQYIKSICALSKKIGIAIKPTDLSKPLDRFYKDREAEEKAIAEEANEGERLPTWVDKNELFDTGFCQLKAPTKTNAVGIYVQEGKFERVTNFTIDPLFHIFEQSNNRRLVEVSNGKRQAVVEIPTQALVNQSIFETELLNKGNFMTLHNFSKKNFKRLTGWLSEKMPIAFELKTLGWQPEGFFAYSNAVWHDGALHHYNDLGMIKIEDKFYMSLGNSKIHKDERQTDNPYENDLFLKYIEPKTHFNEWAQLFCTTYGKNAPYGIAFAFLTLFKDVSTRIAKMPMLYCFGPKGAGKSAMAESITWLFFSGKNSEGDLLKGFNLNPGQGTPFSFFNRVERFRNCPILMNEFDENNIEDWKFGTFKAAYDGEGREVGDGDTGKKRKTKIQKVQGTIIIVGQYLSVKDDGSVLSRSISCQFSLERVTNLTSEQNEAYEKLKAAEQAGLSGILTDLLKHRPEVQKLLSKNFTEVQATLVADTRKDGNKVEARLISNYSLLLAATKTMADVGLQLPYTYDDFYLQCKHQVVTHNRLLKDNNSINNFWKTVEILFDKGFIQNGREMLITVLKEVRIKENSSEIEKTFTDYKNILMVRFSNVVALYSKHLREVNQTAQQEETLLLYLKEQPYFIGLVPKQTFNDKRTSCYAFDYDMMFRDLGVVFEKNHSEEPKPKEEPKKDEFNNGVPF